ncbi:hypothetical protein DFJ74DRAFT_602414 [Hyaloraphidium curvatum]|nr:hypothetical protein DFJ74DRAFT_602414 [Hyaloraphidium curvatum]
MAARHGYADRVRQLLDRKQATVNDTDTSYGGVTPLHWAALHNHAEIINLLLRRDADPNRKAGSPTASPLHWAARAGHVDAVKAMVNRGGNPKIADGQGYNCLHLAVHGNHPKMVTYLLADAGMDVNSEDPLGRTPLIWWATP